MPNEGSLDALFEKRATELVTQIVMRTANTMNLENQANLKKRIENAIKEMVEALKNEMPKNIKTMTIKPIKTKKDYQNALERLELIFDSKKGSDNGDELEILRILIEKYEDEHFPIGFPDPIEAIKFRMEQMGYNQCNRKNITN